MFNKKIIVEQSLTCDNFYLYDEKQILDSICTLKDNFKNIKFLYSIKTNPNMNVVKSIFSHSFGADCASLYEVNLAKSFNVNKKEIQFSAPGKTGDDIEKSIENATIIADSLNEIELIQKVAHEKNLIAQIGIRINPAFSFENQEGLSSKFGIDEQQFFENFSHISSLKNIKIIGIHIHVKSQELDFLKIEKYYKNILQLAIEIQNTLNYQLTFINMGSGIGIPYEKNDSVLNIQKLGEYTSNLVEEFTKNFSNTQIYIETGRYVVGKSGVYVTKVIDKKVSYSKTYVILKNTLNGFLRPSIAQLITKYNSSDNNPASEPLYTTQNPSQICMLNESYDYETVTLVGNLCTATDVVAQNILLPKLDIGDIVVFTNAGSYSYVLSPLQFSNQAPPKELFLKENGSVIE